MKQFTNSNKTTANLFRWLLTVVILIGIAATKTNAQCGQYTTTTACTTAAPAVLNASISCTPPANNGGRRNFVVTGMLAGYTYRCSNCGAGDNQMMIYNSGGTVVGYDDDNGPACTGSAPSIDFIPGANGTYNIQLNAYNCSTTNAVLGTITVTLLAVPPPVLSASALTGFGNICQNTTAGPNSFTITGSNLTAANVTVAALAGYTYSTTSGGSYTSTLSLAQAGGSYSQQIFVKFTPTSVATFNGNIVVGGGGASNINEAATGSGVNTASTVTSGAASGITSNSATVAATTVAGCSAVTSYGIEWSITNAFANGTGTFVASGNLSAGAYSSALSGLTPSTVYYFHAKLTDGVGTVYGSQGTFTTLSLSPIMSATALTSFGNGCSGSVNGPNSFVLTGSNLTSATVSVAALSGFTYCLTSGGSYTTTLSLGSLTGNTNTTIYVKFSPVAVQSYNGNIAISGGGATAINVAAVGSGIASPAAPTGVTANTTICAGTSQNLTATSAGNNINWWDAASGGTLLTTKASGANYSVTPASTATYYAEAQAVTAGSQTISATGTFTVPAGVTSVTAYLWGGGGAGAGSNTAPNCSTDGAGGGGGACAFATFTVVPGNIYNATIGAGGIANSTTGAVGGNGGTTTFAGAAGTWTAGGGTGASGSTTTTGATTLGGAGSSVGTGTGVTVKSGGNGGTSNNGSCAGNVAGAGGGGAGSGANGSSAPAGTGSCAGSGAAGGTGTYPGGTGGYNSQCGVGFANNSGSAGAVPGGGGSGVENYSPITATGGAGGAGQIIITWSIPGCSSSTRVPVTITVNPTPVITVQPTTPTVMCAGAGSQTISVTATGTITSYQWRKNGVSLGTGTAVYSGTQSATLTIASPPLGDNGATFDVIIANGTCSVTSSPAVALTVSQAPTALTYSSNPANYCQNTAITNNTPSNTGGVPTSYSVSPALPTGLSLAAGTGIISGTPTVVTATNNYIVTATNSCGSTNASVSISVNVPVSGLTYLNGTSLSYCNGTTISSNVVSSIAGSGTITYSVAPALPTGLNLSTTTGALTGTPTVVTASANYVVTATNGCSSTTATLSIVVNGIPAIPTSVTATASAICAGSSSLLNATSAGNNISWYNASSGGSLLTTVASGANYSVTPGATTPYYAETQALISGSQTISANGTFTIPAGVTSVTAYLWGGGGAGGGGAATGTDFDNGGGGGGGANASATFNVTAGNVYTATIGAGGTASTGAGTNGGTTTFTGAAGTWTAGGGTGGAAGNSAVSGTNAGGAGSAVGTGTGVSVRTGGNGSLGNNGNSSTTGIAGTGGGAGGSTGNGTTPAANCSSTGTGGTGTYPGGAGGINASRCTASASVAGTAGNVPGGGGSGNMGWAGGFAGGAGGAGQIVLTWTSVGCPSATRVPVTVTVNSIPVGSASPQTVCSGVATSVALGSTVVGTTFTWTAAQLSGSTITGFSNSNGTTIAQTLTNATTSAGVVRYTVTPTGPTPTFCVGSTFTVDVTVNPKPTATATPANQTICSGNAPSIALTSNIGSSTFAWTTNLLSGTITGFSNSSGTTIAQTLTNTGTIQGQVRYTVTPTSPLGCAGTAIQPVITVNPKPVLTVSANEYLCSPQASGLGLSANVASTFTWTATASSGSVTGYNNCSSSCGSTIAQTITNSGTTTEAVTYVVTATSTVGSCASTSVTAIDSIGAAPVASYTGTTTFCGSGTLALNLSSTIATSDLAWAATLISGSATGFNDCNGGCGNVITDTLTNSGTTPSVVRYTVSTSASQSGCQGIDMIINVTINPVPVGSAANILLCSGSSTNISLSSTVANTSYVWTSATLSGTVIGAGTCSSNCGNSIADVLFSTSGVAVVEYTITPTSALGCGGANFTSDVTINQPSVAPTTLNGATIVCSGGSGTTITQTGGTLGTGAYWQWHTAANYSVASAIGGQLTSSDASLTVTPSTTTTYYLRAEGGTAPCAANVAGPSGGVQVQVTVGGFWIGITSTDWFDASNWCGGVPTSTTNVHILTTAPFMPVINAAGAVCHIITISAGTSLTMTSAGDLTVYGNWLNNGTFTPGGGTVTFAGTVANVLSGTSANNFSNIYTNNSSTTGVTINTDITVSSLLQMDNGNLHTGSNMVILDTNAVGIATGGFVIGNVQAYVLGDSSGSASVSYPVGTGTSYTPVDLFIDSVSTSGFITVTTTAGDHPNIATGAFTAGSSVNRYWTVTNNGVGFTSASLGLQYVPADLDGGVIEANLQAQAYSGSAWGTVLIGVNSPGYEFVSGITSFGDFQVGQLNPAPSLYSLNPTQGAQGQTLNVDFIGGGFINGSSSVDVGGADITVNTTTVSGDTLITANVTISPTATLGARNFTVTNAGPGGGTSTAEVFTVITALPVADFLSNTVVIPCNTSGTAQFTNYSTNATSYLWNFGAGASPATSTSAGPVTVSYTTTGLKTVTLTATNANGSDVKTRTNYISVSNTAPTVPLSIAGPLGLCGLLGTNVVYSCPIVNGAASYFWTVPSGVSLSGQNSNAITVVFPIGFTSGNISVHSVSGCGSSIDRTIAVAAPAPAILGTIAGPDVVCGVNSATYSVTPVAGASSYTWTVPTGVTGMTITGGQGTNSLNVNCSAGTIIGYVTVYATGTCGTSVIDSLKVTKKPEVHGAISGPTVLCGLTTATYSVSPVFGATSYAWTLPAGMTVSGGATGNSINVNITSVASTGQVKVSAVNTCGNVPGTVLNVTGSAPAIPVTLSGTATNLCGVASATYSVPVVVGASLYIWSLPSGVTVVGAGGGNSITVNTTGYTTGNISVMAHDTCGNSAARTLILTRVAIQPGAIGGPTTVCGLTTATYTIAAVGTGYTYTWSSTMTGWPITSANGGTSITVSGPATGTSLSGQIRVTSTNTCASTSAYRTQAVTYCHDGIAMNNGDDASGRTFSDIYPNPAASEFTINMSSDKDEVIVVEVYDILGNLIISEKHSVLNGESTLKTNMEQYQDGMYFVRLMDNNSNVIYTQRVVKQ